MGTTATRPQALPSQLGGEGLAMVAQAVLALHGAADLGAACGIAGACARQALDAADCRLLRLDARSGALFRLEDSGVEIPYAAEHGGPVDWALRHEQALFDEGADGADAPRETLLWRAAPAALVTMPLRSGSTLFGFLLLAFAVPRTFAPAERLFLQTLADALALAVERAELRRTVEAERQRSCELERRLGEDEETASNRMSIVAHEIRAPLAAIKAYAETMLDGLADPHLPRERFLRIINEECDRITRIVSDILELSRLEAGQRPLHLERLELGPVVQEVLDRLLLPSGTPDLRFEVLVDPGLDLEADPDLLRRLLVNLLSNALKYSPAGGVVRVRGTTRGEELSAVVEDQGPGIPAEELPRVFERFYRARQPGDQVVEGTGLGLAIARGIVELHGGRIWAESLAPLGTRMCFTLPRRQIASARARSIARQVWSRADLRGLFEAAVEMVAAAMDAGIVSLMLVDPERGDLFVAAALGLDGQNLDGRRATMRSGVAGSVAAWGRPVLVNNIETDRRFRRLNHPQYRTKSLLCVPLRLEGEVIGVINVNNKLTGDAFDEDDLSVLVALVERVAGAVERACASPDTGGGVAEALEAVRSVTRLKRQSLLGGRNLVRRARATALELRMSPADVDVIGYVASVHDLGMTRVCGPLEGADRLAPEQWQALHEHPEASVDMLRPLEYVGAVRELILSHHEHWDGSGYPRGLRGEEIPLGGRVLAVADAYESMTAGRPHRPPRPPEEALAELRAQAGHQFDPDVVEAFARVVEREGAAG